LSIELRLTNIDPPTEEPQRTIYRDIVNLPDPVKLGMTVRYFNHDSVTLYFQITGSGLGYTFGTVNLGSLAAGTDAYINLDEFASKAKPSAGDLPNGEKDENITLILRAYTDAGYSNLKWTYERTVGIHWINSADPAFTVDFLNNFDDGTVQGWATANETGNWTVGGFPHLHNATDYVLSTPYSLRTDSRCSTVSGRVRTRTYKSFTTPNKNKVYAILDLRCGGAARSTKYLTVNNGDTVLVYIGRPYDAVVADYYPKNKWRRVIVPLPKNTSVEVRIVVDFYQSSDAESYSWLDDFKIISKD